MGSRNSIFWETPPPSPFTPTHHRQSPNPVTGGGDEEPSPISRKSSMEENVNPFTHSSPCCRHNNKKKEAIINMPRLEPSVAGLGIRLQKDPLESVKVKRIQTDYHIDLSSPIASQVFTKVYRGSLSTSHQVEIPVVFKVADVPTVMHEARVLTYLIATHHTTTETQDLLSNNNIVGFRGVIDGIPALVLDRYPFDLAQYIENNIIISQVQDTQKQTCPIIGLHLWKTIALSLLRALSYLKKHQVIHGDIKTDNVFMQLEPVIQIVLGDFSSASLAGYPYDSGSVYDRTTCTYAAPELLRIPPKPASYSSDLFAVGLVLLQAATGVPPYSQAIKSPSQKLIWAQRGRPLDCLSDNALARISNPSVYRILDMCLLERAEVDSVIGSLSL